MGFILEEGGTCWRILRAGRVKFLIDGEAYFNAFFRAATRAKKTILIAGWDIDSRIRLFPEQERDGYPSNLGDFLLALVGRNRSLQVYVLGWDFSAIYVFSREWLPVFRLPWGKHRRIHFHLDGKHPIGGSQHQKLVVIDDAIAFVGGIDLTRRRWDTAEHKAYDPRRIDPTGGVYGPFHDVQMAVDEGAAETLGSLFRVRWERATGKVLHPPARGGSDPWPPELVPDIRDIDVAVARTDPAFDGRRAIREVERLYLRGFSAARRFIYMENQYLTSFSVASAIAESLRRETGPEIVIILRAFSEWLEETTMGVFRARLLARIRETDTHGRLKIYYPAVPGLDGEGINLHSKLTVVDDSFVRVGSSNLTNRSMAVDTECDLAFESAGEKRVEECIARFRNTLLAEHLGVPRDEVERGLSAEGSLIRAIEKLRGGTRTLIPFPEEVVPWASVLLPDETIDPVEPIDPEKLLFEFEPEEVSKKGPRRLVRFIIVILLMVGIALAWHWTPLREWLDPEAVSAAGEYLHETGAAPLVVIAGYVVGSLVLFPVTVMILATAFIFGPLSGFLLSLLGCLSAATVTYGLGRLLGRDLVSRVAGSRLNRIRRRLARHGVLVVLIARILPVAPFTIVNLVAGASHIRLFEFLLGTALGMIPGIAAATVFEHQLVTAIRNPDIYTLGTLAAIVAFIAAAVWSIRRRLFTRGGSGEGRQ